MIDNQTEYLAIKKACNNEFVKTEKVVGSECANLFTLYEVRWEFNEEYVMTHKSDRNDVDLFRWHTPNVMDGGVSVSATLIQSDTKPGYKEVLLKAISDGIVELGVIDTVRIQLERHRGRMYSIAFNEKTRKFSVSYFDDVDREVFIVQYFDYIANAEIVRKVWARSENEAKIIAWAQSPYSNKPIVPENYSVCRNMASTPKSLADVNLSDACYAQQLALCEAYDKEQDE